MATEKQKLIEESNQKYDENHAIIKAYEALLDVVKERMN